MWVSMIFIHQFQSIYCLSFCLKREGMNYLDDNFKISRIIWNTNMINTKISDVLVYPKKWLSKCRDRLRLTYEDSQGPALRIASHVQDLWARFRQKFSLMSMYDGGVPYISPIEAWINKVCQSDASPWHQFQVFQILRKV